MKRRKHNFLLSLIFIIFIVIILIGGTYYYYFYPKTQVKSINSNIDMDKLDLAKKLLPKDLNISMRNTNIESQASFSQDNITDLLIFILNQNNKEKQYLTGLKASINKSSINIFIHLDYNGIPLEGKLVFTAESKDGKGVFHYNNGKIGFIDIPKDKLFSLVSDTELIHFDKSSGDIILSLNHLKNFKIKDITLSDGTLNIKCGGSLNPLDLIKKK